MSGKLKHTPLPWGVLVVPNASQCAVIPVNAKGKPRNGRETEDIAACDNPDDARLISLAVNSRADLIAACEAALPCAAVAAESGPKTTVQSRAHAAQVYEQLLTAIAKAKGGVS